MKQLTEEEFLAPGGDAVDVPAALSGAALESVYWKFHATSEELARKERFWASTNQALEQAYVDLEQRTAELRVAQAKIVELERQRTEQLMAGGFAHEVRNALAGARLLVDKVLHPADDGPSMMHQNALVLRDAAVSLKQQTSEDLSSPAASQSGPGKLFARLRSAFMREEQLQEVMLGTETAVLRALDLASMLLEYTRTGEDVSKLDLLNLYDVGQRVLKAQTPRAESLRVELSLVGTASLATVRADASRLYSAIDNLVQNSLDAHRDAAELDPRDTRVRRVELSIEVVNDRVRFKVSDNGPGVAEAHRSRVFEPFFSTKPNTGTGLGLPFAVRTVQAVGGRLDLCDQAVGAAFVIDLPRVVPSKELVAGQSATTDVVAKDKP